MTILAFAYPVGLLIAVLLFRFVGEAWWVTAVGMFLPRIGFGLPLLFLVPALVLLRDRRLWWTLAAACVLLVFPLMGFVLPGLSARAAGPRLRVMSFNVDSANVGREAIAHEIAAFDPDIVMIQESTEWSKLHELLHERYPVVEVSTQFLFASRWSPTSTTNPKRIWYVDRDRSPRFLRHVVSTPLGRVTFYNVHPVSPRESFYELRGGSGFRNELRSGRLLGGSAKTTIEDNAGLRALQIRTFARHALAESGPVVLGGDLNQPNPSPLLANELSGFRDAFNEGSWGFGYTFPGAAFKARRTPKVPFLRLDRLLVRGSIAVTNFWVGCRGVSDHLCVVADLSLIR